MSVSIVTPTFNAAKYIEQTILSVIKQSYKKWEWVIVDGGSSDNTIEILEKYSLTDKRISFIISNSDSGPAEARANAIKNSSGKYIAFLDADDLWHNDKLKIQTDFMLKNNIKFSYTLCRELQKNNKYVSVILPTSSYFTYSDYLKKRGIYAFTTMIKRNLLTDDIINVWSKDSYDDTIWWLLILKKGTVAHLLPKDLGLYRISDNQLSSRRLYTIRNVYFMYDKFKDINILYKHYLFLNYLINSLKRHIKLKLFKKIDVIDSRLDLNWYLNINSSE